MQIPEEETRKKGDFLRSLSVTPSPTLAAPVPYYTTAGLAIISDQAEKNPLYSLKWRNSELKQMAKFRFSKSFYI